MADHELHLLDLALEKRLLTRKQGDLVRDELAMFPGERAGHLMLRKHYLTEEQLEELRAAAGGAGDPEPDRPVSQSLDGIDQMETVQTVRPPQAALRPTPPPEPAPVAPPAPKPQLSVKDLQEREARAAAAAAPAPQASPPATSPPPPPGAPPPPQRKIGKPYAQSLIQLLKLARHWGCSDLHITAGRPPFIRLQGQIRYMEMEPVSAEQSEWLTLGTLSEPQYKEALEELQVDYSLELPGVGRHRCNVFRSRLGWDGAYRIVSNKVPTLSELGLPDSVRTLTDFAQGLVMVTGPGGSGKTTTVAALLNLVNEARRDHIITVEDPVEYIIPSRQCQVTQREVGRDTRSFAAALRAALREDPDIIFVGEMRDVETTGIAISASETGHLVFGTMHTSSAGRTVSRIVDIFPLNQQSQIQVMVAESLRGVISQQLIPRRDGQGVALALEVLVNTSGIAAQIKDGKTHLITSAIQAGKRLGMMLMDESIRNLHQAGVISGRDAWLRATNKAPFEAMKEQ